MAIPRERMQGGFTMRVSEPFRKELEAAALKAGFTTASAFVREAVREKAARHGAAIKTRN